MGVARSGLWAPSISEFPVRKFSDNKDPGGGGIPGNSWWGCAARFLKS